MKNRILYSAIITPDLTLLASYNRHDIQIHSDSITGKEYGIDGGNDYQRLIGDFADTMSIIVRINDPISVLREITGRSGYGKNGDEEFRCSLLKDMSDEWVTNSIDYVDDTEIKQLYVRELEYRKEKGIKVLEGGPTEDSWYKLVTLDSLNKLFNLGIPN
tara:strand:- start:2668 stop:3147 length:480 start_codon:yes stop_codon:yes gene_type:complete